jgi:hypothetical protein
MKSLIGLLLLAVGVPLFGNSPCDRLENYDMRNLKTSVEQDLNAHVWQSALPGKLARLYFQEDGIVLVVPEEEARVESYTWEIIDDDGQVILRLFSQNGEQTFALAPTCNGLIAVMGARAIPMVLDADHQVSEAIVGAMESQIIGTWNLVSKRKARSNPGDLSLRLNTDGTFHLTAGPDVEHSSQEGIWQLAPDGSALILFTKVYIDGHLRYMPEAIDIVQLDYEDMALSTKQLPRILKEYGHLSNLYLSKNLAM